MICRASMSWEARHRVVVGSHREAKVPVSVQGWGAPRRAHTTPCPGGRYLPAVVSHFEDGRLPGDLAVGLLLHAAFLLGT